MPKVSIIIPLFNKELFITEALKSVVSQTFQDWECILIDDGSTDNSYNLVEEFIAGKSRFSLLKRPFLRKKGASTCRNIGLEHSSSEYIQFFDADDLLSRNKLEKQVEILDRNTENDLVTCKWGRVKGSEKYLYEKFESYRDFSNIPEFLNSLAASKGYFPLHAYLIKREVIKRAGPWNEFLITKNDGEFMMRVIANCRKIKFSPETVVWYRIAEVENLSRLTDAEAVDKAILGWKISEAYLELHFDQKHKIFVDWYKNQLYVLLKNTNPQLFAKHRNYFKDQIRNRSLVAKVKRKIRKWSKPAWSNG